MNKTTLLLPLLVFIASVTCALVDTGPGAATTPGGAATDGTFLYMGVAGNPSRFYVYKEADLSCVYSLDTTAHVTQISNVFVNPTMAVLVGENAAACVDLNTRTITNTIQTTRATTNMAFSDSTHVYILTDSKLLEKRTFDLSLVGSLQLDESTQYSYVGTTSSSVALLRVQDPSGNVVTGRIDLASFTLLSSVTLEVSNKARMLGDSIFDYKVTNSPKGTCSAFAVSAVRYDSANEFVLAASSDVFATGDYQCGGGIVAPQVEFSIDASSTSLYVLSSTSTRSVSGMSSSTSDQTLFILDSSSMKVTGGSFQLNTATFFSPTSWTRASSYYLNVNGALLYAEPFAVSVVYNPDTDSYTNNLKNKAVINRVVNQALTNSVTVDSANCVVAQTTVSPTVATTTAPSPSTTTTTTTTTTSPTSASGTPTTSTKAPSTPTSSPSQETTLAPVSGREASSAAKITVATASLLVALMYL
jgi:hypothetical protein